MRTRRLLISIVGVLLCAATCFAAQSVIDFTEIMTAYPQDNTKLQFSAPDPLLTLAITSNASNTINLRTIPIPTASTVYWPTNPVLLFNLYFNGSGSNCIVRLMNNTTKASWVAYPILPATQGHVFTQAINPNTLYINYSGCSS
jgi:hypothetical protein